MTDTHIPGLKAAHQKVTPECRKNRGGSAAFEEAIRRVRNTFADYADETGSELVTWHLVLVREDRPAPTLHRNPNPDTSDRLGEG